MGIPPQGGGAPAQGGGGSAPPPGSVGPAQGMNAVPGEVMQSRVPQTGYTQKILQRSQPNMNMPSASAQPAPAGS